MDITLVPVAEINAAPYNPRRRLKPGDGEYEKLRRSIERFGFVEPLVLNRRSGILVGGHQRLQVMADLGRTEVPCVVVELGDAEERALNVALNKISGRWDDAKLAEVLAGLQAMPDFDATLTGFTEPEMDVLFEKQLGDAAPRLEAGDGLASAPGSEVTRPGELLELGGHRLLCGDATDPAAVAELLGDERPGLMVTDPPYGVEYAPSWRSVLGSIVKRDGVVSNDDRADWTEAWRAWPADVVYCWHAARFGSVVQFSLEAAGYEIRSQVIWSKPHFPISRGHYHWQHEPCLYAVRRGSAARWKGGRKQTTVWEIPLDAAAGDHGTQKPIECMARPVKNHDFPLVCDPFLGSGTTLVACEQLGRRCFGMELSPRYCDAIVRRWLSVVGKRKAPASLRRRFS